MTGERGAATPWPAEPGSLSWLSEHTAPVLTVGEVAALFGVDPRTVRAGITSGDLPAVRVGHKWFIPTARLRARLGIAGPADLTDHAADLAG